MILLITNIQNDLLSKLLGFLHCQCKIAYLVQAAEFILNSVKDMQQIQFKNLIQFLKKSFVPCIPYLALIKENIRNVEYVNESFCEGEAVPGVGIFQCNVTSRKHVLFGARLVFVSNAWLPRHLQTSSEKRCV